MASVFKPKGSKKYVILYHDENGDRRKKTGATDKAVTERIARDLENRIALRREGVIDPKAEAYRDHEARPLSAHLADWVKDLNARGGTPKHSELFSARAARVVALVKGAKLDEIEAPRNAKRSDSARAEATLMKWVESARPSDLTAERVQQALATLKAEGRSHATCNHHRAAIRSFSKWCYETHRSREHALRGVKGFNVKEDRRHDRRTLSLDELQRLIKAAAHGPDVMGMTGPARSLCYWLAASSGLRFSEIASIRPASFDWKAPSVTIPAAYTKNGDPATLPIPRDLAVDLAPFVGMLAPGSPVFRLPEGKGAEMLRVDLAAAGIPYRDDAGLVFDFHSLRCETATLADAAGVTPRVVQKLMRHSSLELTGRYTRPRAVDVEAATSMLPSLKPAGERPDSMVMTGTDSSPLVGSTATENATSPEDDGPKPFGGMPVTTRGLRTFNPLVLGSSPSPVICGRDRQEPSRAHNSKDLRRGDPTPSSRPLAALTGPVRPSTATETATNLLPTDPDLAAVVDAWDRLPDAIRAGIVAMVKAASKEGGR